VADLHGIITDSEPVVVDIDLRDRYEDLLSFGNFSELQLAFARGLGIVEADLGRILIVDDTHDLEKHTPGIERIVGAPGVRQVICLVVGPAAHEIARGYETLFGPDSATGGPRGRRTALRKPFALRAPHVTLWVGDARGVGWEMNQIQPRVLAVGDAPDNGPMLDAVIEALRSPQVFDAVYETVGALPDGAAAPGLRAMIGRADDDVLADAQVRAIDRLLTRRRVDADDPPPANLVLDPLALMLNNRRYPRTPQADEGDVLRPEGPIGQTLAGCERLVATADRALKLVSSRGALLRPGGISAPNGGRGHVATVWQSIRDTGRQLSELRDELETLFVQYDTRHPLETRAVLDLEERGFDLATPDGTSSRESLAAIQFLIRGGLGAPGAPGGRYPITEINGWLARMHADLVPTGSARRVAELDACCGEDTVRRIANPPRFVLRLTAARALLAALLCALFATVAPGSVVVGLPVGIAATAAVAVGGWRLAVARAPSPVDLDLADLAVLCLAALVGVGLGVTLTVLPGADPVLVLPVRVAAFVAALTGLVWWPQHLWSRALARWRAARFVEFTDQAVRAVRALTVEVALHDWVLIAPRRRAADLTKAMSTAFDDITGSLTRHADRLRGRPPAPRDPPAPGLDVEVADLLRERSPDITTIVGDDLVEAVGAVVERCWSDLERDALDALAHWVTGEADATLAGYAHHLDRMGIHAAPPFAVMTDTRRDLVARVWRDSRRLGGLLGAAVTDPGILQLCAPEHLQLLDVTPATARQLRFAPKAAQHTLGRAQAGTGAFGDPFVSPLRPESLGELIWTDWGQVAGVMRLAKLRPGSVETILEEEGP
jgi:hypothetical protein